MNTTEAKEGIDRIIVLSQNWNACASKSRMAIKLIAIEHRSVVRRHIQLTSGDVHLASEKSIAASVSQSRVIDFVAPTTCDGIFLVEQWSARDDNSGAFARIVIVICCPEGPWRRISVITTVITNCTANDGFY